MILKSTPKNPILAKMIRCRPCPDALARDRIVGTIICLYSRHFQFFLLLIFLTLIISSFFKLSDMKINLVLFDRLDKILENVDFVWFL